MPTGIIEALDYERRIGFIREENPEGGESIRRFFGFNESYLADIKKLAVGDAVVYQLAPDRNPERPDKALSVRATGAPDLLWDWAYFPNRTENLQELAGMALQEKWHFGETPDPERPTPILFNYLQYTFLKVQLEKKLCFSAEGTFAAFNTGLVTPLYQPLIAAFRKNAPHARQPFILEGFCVPGERGLGKDVVRNTPGDLLPPEYFSDTSELLYQNPSRMPEVDWHHIIVDGLRHTRFPTAFIAEVCRDALEELKMEPDAMSSELWSDLAEYIFMEPGMRTMRRMQTLINDALEMSLKRVRWNYRTVVPMWYPARRFMHLLLPLSLVCNQITDVALVVEQVSHAGQKRKYIGHTVLPLNWAYMNARLICRPDSDWLTPSCITHSE